MVLKKLLLTKSYWLVFGTMCEGVCLCVCVCVYWRHKVLLHCSLYTISRSQPWRSLVFNGASAHWSGRQSSVLVAVWYMETSLCLKSPAAVKTLSWSCSAMWKTEGGGRCSFENDFKVFLLLRCLIVALTAGLVWSMLRSRCMFTGACMWSVHMHVHDLVLTLLWQELSYFACECQWFAPKYLGNYFCLFCWLYCLWWTVWIRAVACTLTPVPPGLP